MAPASSARGWCGGCELEFAQVSQKLFQQGQVLNVNRGITAGNPITNEVELAQRLRELCGADGYRVEAGKILALRWDSAGNEVVIDRFEACQVNG
jgi:CRP-like cAMP-binding protein